MFIKGFGKHVCDGDKIRCSVDGFDVVATAHYDDDTTPPYERVDGFWPSHEPNNAGYVKPEDFDKAQEEAQRIMDAWNNDEWHYFGVAVTVYKNDVKLTGDYNNALWGIETNLPGSHNVYLLEVANDLISSALDEAKEAIAKMAEPEEKLHSTLKKIAWMADAGRQYNPGTEQTMRELFIQIRDTALEALNDAVS
jgi:hypothetical protein